MLNRDKKGLSDQTYTLEIKKMSHTQRKIGLWSPDSQVQDSFYFTIILNLLRLIEIYFLINLKYLFKKNKSHFRRIFLFTMFGVWVP